MATDLSEVDLDNAAFTYVQHGKKNRRTAGKDQKRASFEERFARTADMLNKSDWTVKLIRAFMTLKISATI